MKKKTTYERWMERARKAKKRDICVGETYEIFKPSWEKDCEITWGEATEIKVRKVERGVSCSSGVLINGTIDASWLGRWRP